MKSPFLGAASLLVAIIFSYVVWSGHHAAQASLPSATVSGTVSSLSSNTLPTTLFLTIGKNLYTINISRITHFYLKNGGAASLQQLANGDTIKIVGKRRSATVIDAQAIRFSSWNSSAIVRTGKVIEKNCANNNVVIRYRSQRILVSFPTVPTIIRLGSTIRCQDIQTGETLQVFGSWIPGAMLGKRVLATGEIVTATVKSVSINAADKTATLNILIKNKVVKALISPQTQLLTTSSTPLLLANIDVGHTIRIRGIRTVRGTFIISYLRDASMKKMGGGKVVSRLSLPTTSASVHAQAGIVGRVTLPGWGNTLKMAGSIALIADPNIGLIMVDVHDRTAPRIVGRYENGKHISAVAGMYPWVFVGDEDGLTVLDITDPGNPEVLAVVADPRRDGDGFPILPIEIQAWGSTLVMSASVGGIAIFDLSNPYLPVLKSHVNADPSGMWLDTWERLHTFGQSDTHLPTYTGKYGYWVLDLADKSQPQPISYQPTFNDRTNVPYLAWTQDNIGLDYWALGGWRDWGLYSYGLSLSSTLEKKDGLTLEVNRIAVDPYAGCCTYPLDRRGMIISGHSERTPKILNFDFTDPYHLMIDAEISSPDFKTLPNGNGDGGVMIGAIAQMYSGTAVVLRPIDTSSDDTSVVLHPAELFVVQFDKP